VTATPEPPARYYKALRAAGIAHLRFHDLRLTFGTLAVLGREGIHGSRRYRDDMIYVHHVPQHDAAGRLSARLSRIPAPHASTAG